MPKKDDLTKLENILELYLAQKTAPLQRMTRKEAEMSARLEGLRLTLLDNVHRNKDQFPNTHYQALWRQWSQRSATVLSVELASTKAKQVELRRHVNSDLKKQKSLSAMREKLTAIALKKKCKRQYENTLENFIAHSFPKGVG